MQDAPKAVWSIPYVSVAFFPSFKQNFIAYRSSEVSDCIFEIHQLWQSGFSRVYSNCCCSCSFEREIIKIGQSSHKMYSNNIVNFQESTTILNAHTKKVWKLIVCTSYIEILDNFLILSIENWFRDEVIFPHDNASCHIAKRPKAFLQVKYIKIKDIASKQSGFKSYWKFMMQFFFSNDSWEGSIN